MLNWTDVVNNFESLVLYWTLISLVWGVTTAYFYHQLRIKAIGHPQRADVRKTDQHNIQLVWLINIMCLAYLAVSPFSNFLNTSFIVINIFYTNFLAYLSIHLFQWAQAIKRELEDLHKHHPIIH